MKILLKMFLVCCLLTMPGCAAFSPDPERFTVNNGTVVDSNTGLMWAETASHDALNWEDAKTYCENYQAGGYRDWRLPSKKELEGLYSAKIRTDDEIILIGNEWVWASETKDIEAAYCNFSGKGNFDDKHVCGWVTKFSSLAQCALPVRNTNVVSSVQPQGKTGNNGAMSVEKKKKIMGQLKLIKQLRDDGIMTPDEYEQQRLRFLKELGLQQEAKDKKD